MANEQIQSLVEQAVDQQYAAWASRHPSLASVIDQVTLKEQAVQSLRATTGYQEAVAAFHQAAGNQPLMAELLNLADVVLAAILK